MVFLNSHAESWEIITKKGNITEYREFPLYWDSSFRKKRNGWGTAHTEINYRQGLCARATVPMAKKTRIKFVLNTLRG